MDQGITRLFENQIAPAQLIGRQIKFFKSVSSTNDVAFELALKGEQEGTVVLAAEQTKGRGRLNRKWVSLADKGLYFSFILRPQIRPDEAQEITLMSALAVVNAVRKITNLAALVKWPNDVLVDGGKICGILTEMDADTDQVRFLVVGIGVNLNQNEKELPPGAASLKEFSKKEIDLENFLRELLQQLDRYYSVFKKDKSAIIQEWKSCTNMWGKTVKIKTADKEIHGQAIDLDERGALIIRLDNGFMEKVLSGDVVI